MAPKEKAVSAGAAVHRSTSYVNFLSRTPFNVESFEKLPYLPKEEGIAALTISGLALVLLVTQVLTGVDPWAKIFWKNGSVDSYPIGLVTTAILTSIIARKQWTYYYSVDSNNEKAGIFKAMIKQVSDLERTLDLILAVLGAVVMGLFIITPVLWFAGLGFYCTAAALRCFVTLKRKDYANDLSKKGWDVPSWYTWALDQDYTKEYTKSRVTVKYVVGGWIVTHCAIAVLAFAGLLTLLYIFPLVPPEVGALLVLAFAVLAGLLFFGLSKRSYSWGKWVCARMGLEETAVPVMKTADGRMTEAIRYLKYFAGITATATVILLLLFAILKFYSPGWVFTVGALDSYFVGDLFNYFLKRYKNSTGSFPLSFPRYALALLAVAVAGAAVGGYLVSIAQGPFPSILVGEGTVYLLTTMTILLLIVDMLAMNPDFIPKRGVDSTGHVTGS